MATMPDVPGSLTASLNGRDVTLLETRRSAEMSALVERFGGKPHVIPSLREVETTDLAPLERVIRGLENDPPAAVVFQTGVGVEYLFRQLQSLGDWAEPAFRAALAGAATVARGPKPTAALGKLGIRIDHGIPTPFTTRQIIATIAPLAIDERHVLVQGHGGSNVELRAYLASRNARIDEIEVYRWGTPSDLEPLKQLIRDIAGGTIDVLVFTSASQVEHLFLAADELRLTDELTTGLRQAPLVAAVGPVCAAALEHHGVGEK